MNFINLESLSLFWAIVLFVVSGVVVWIAGTKLTKTADDLATQTGLGRAFIGTLLLGGITSLPEIATTITAALQSKAGLAISNLLGGISMQVTILTIVDFSFGKKPLSSSSSHIVIFMQGVALILLLALAGAFMLVPTFSIFHIGANSFFILLLFLCSLYFVHHYNSMQWLPYRSGIVENLESGISHLQEQLKNTQSEKEKEEAKISAAHYWKKHWLKFLIPSLFILVAGYSVVRTSEVIARETGLSANFAGLVLVAITTSLPEITTTLGSIRLKRYDMAISNIFGTNLFDIALIFVADVFYFKGSIFNELDQFTLFATFLGIVLTAVYMIGISVRSQKQILGIGYDSLIVLLTYLLGIFTLYTMGG